jgi:hypothetical protein
LGAHDDLLKRFQPALRYDSNEQFFADSAAEFTEAPGIELRRAATADGASGAVIARSVPVAGEPELTLDFLGPQTYGNGAKVQRTDVIGVQGTDYRARYRRLRAARRDLANRMYGHAVEVGGDVWLQYWFWYFYNDYQLALGLGTHEGDWEMVQLRIHQGKPDVAVYTQHTSSQKRAWADVEKLASDPNRPVVYVARGSHGAYFDPGFHPTDAWYDIADGKRPAPADLALETVDDDAHAWLRWPGFWGDTKPRDSTAIFDAFSPTSPGTRSAWTNPGRLLDAATTAVARTPPRAPDVRIARGRDNRLEIAYDFSDRDPQPRALVVTVNSRDEKGVPPMTHTFEDVAAKRRGTLKTDIAIDPAHHYDIYASTVAGDPPVPSDSTLTELDPARPEPDRPFWQRVTRVLARVVAWIRGDR